MEERKALIEELVRRIGELPPEKRESFYWLLSHWKLATLLVSQERMSAEAWERIMKRAVEQKDEFMQLLLQYHDIYWLEADKNAGQTPAENGRK